MRDGADIVRHQRDSRAAASAAASVDLPAPEGSAEQHGAAVHAHRAGVQHDLPALVQQDAEDRADDEDRDVGRRRRRARLEGDVAAVAEQKARDAGNAQQKPPAGDLPGRPDGAGAFQRLAAPARNGSLTSGGVAPAGIAIKPGKAMSLPTDRPETLYERHCFRSIITRVAGRHMGAPIIQDNHGVKCIGAKLACLQHACTSAISDSSRRP